MRAYWEEARNIGDREELLALAVEGGLDEARARGVIDGNAYQGEVLASTRNAQALGITGIPAFLLNRRLLVLGAQPQDVFEQALRQLAGDEEHAPRSEGTTDATS